MIAVPSYTVMVSPAVPLPLNTGCVASVTSLSVSSPTLLPVLSVRVTIGTTGGVVSTVIVMGAEGVLVWFSASVAVTVKVWSPSPSTGVVSVQLPLLSTVAVPASGVPPSRMVMVAPGFTGTVEGQRVVVRALAITQIAFLRAGIIDNRTDDGGVWRCDIRGRNVSWLAGIARGIGGR